jgi:hypothetical protein
MSRHNQQRRPRQLGKALGILARAAVREDYVHADVEAFGGPGECHGAVSRGEGRRLRQAKRHAKAASGLSRAAFNRELRAVPQRVLQQGYARAAARHYPF